MNGTQTAKINSLPYDYSISGWVRDENNKQVAYSVKLSAIVAAFGDAVPAYLTAFISEGVRYSGQDFDTLSAAMNDLYRAEPGIWLRIGAPCKY